MIDIKRRTLLYNFTLKDILDLTVKIYGIGNLSGMVMFSIYVYLTATCDYGKKSQDQYLPLFYKNITIDGKFSI